MITGVRLTQLAEGEPLLGTSWSYQNLYGIDAVEKRLEDLFYYAKYLGFNYIIDTVKPQLDVNGNLTLNNNGLYGNVWSFDRRMELYRQYASETQLKVLLEIDFPTNITNDNLQKYADYFTDQLIQQYNWVTNWQIMIAPESVDSFGNYKCSPENYVEFMKLIYPKVKDFNDLIKIGGPEVFNALSGFYYNNDTYSEQWLSIALGEKFGQDPQYDSIGSTGFIPYIDFFSIQGKQNTEALNYTVFPLIINKLRSTLLAKSDKNIPIYSLVQGWQAPENDSTALNQQGYYELREILNCIKNNVMPFKYQLVDEYYDPNSYNNIDPSQLNYGLFTYYLGNDSEKPAGKEYYFLLKNLLKFNQVTSDNDVIENNSNIDSITLMNDSQDTSVTILWTKNLIPETITLKPHYARQYMLPDGTEQKIINPTQITFKDYHFILVFETIEQVLFDVESLENQISSTLNYTEQTLKHLVNLLSSTYNKEVRDTNYYKLLRSLAIELADAKFEVQELKDNIYLDSAHNDAIYNNFGVLVNLKKQDEWDYDKYRRLVKGVTKSLLNGPTPKSIVDAIQLFTNFNVSISELYKSNKFDPLALQNVNPQFAFVVEIETPIGASADPSQIYSDVNYVLNIIKPAHTIQLVVIVLTGTEDYRKQYLQKYKQKFSDSDKYTRYYENKVDEAIFGWKSQNYPAQFKTANVNMISNNPMTNGGLFIGPRYVLYDNENLNVESFNNDSITNEFLESINSLLELPIDIDNYKGSEETSYSELDRTIKEQKFGLDLNNLIQLSNGLTTLNNYKLGLGSKLDDNEFYDFEDFLEEKDIGPNDSPNQFITLNQTGLNGAKFLSNKKITEYFIEMDLTDEDNKIIKDFFEDELDYLLLEKTNPYLEDLTSSLLKDYSDKIKHIENKFDVNYEYNDKSYDIHNNDYFNYDVNINNGEYYRSINLGPVEYHIHKKLVKILDSNNNYTIMLPYSDLFILGYNDIESMTKVYVNGVLMPYWSYIEIQSSLDPKRSNGIEFIEDIIFPGDIINILYLKDRNVFYNDFPITENNDFGMESIDNTNKWRDNSIMMFNRMTLNISTLNNSLLIGYNQEVKTMEFTLFDEIPSPVDSLTM